MSIESQTNLIKKIREKNIEKIYYFYGHDVAALENFTKKLILKLCPKEAQALNFHKFEGKNLDISQLSDAVQNLPMFAERSLIAINDLNMDDINKDDGDALRKILKNLDETTTVIIYATGVDLYKNKKNLTDKNKRFCDFCDKNGVVCEFAYKRVSDLGKAIASALSKNGCTVSKQNAEYIANLCLCDSAFIKQEIAKLSAFAKGREITRQDIDMLCIRRIESDGYSLAINILHGNAQMVFGRLKELVMQNYEAFEILSIISFSLTDIYRAKLARASGLGYMDVVNDFKYPRNREFAIKNAYSECGNISGERIRRTLEILSQTDLKLKTKSSGKDGDMLTLEQGLAKSMALRC